MRVWIDIENPPQVRYQLPFKRLFEDLGAEVIVTARATFGTRRLLVEEGIEHTIIGRPSRRKTLASLSRAAKLASVFARRGRPDLLIAGSRAAALAAWATRIPCFTFCDYEYVHLALYPRLGTYVLHPLVVPQSIFTASGLSPTQLIGFDGLKEDITFADVDLDGAAQYVFPDEPASSLTRVLFRPPAEDSHYYRAASGEVSMRVLTHFAGREDAVVIFSPRTESQVEMLGRLQWIIDPIVLRDPVSTVPLLKAVDLVVSGGGTMTREAAYLGVPAWSVFQNEVGAVDSHLSKLGRLRLIDEGATFPPMPPRRKGLDPIPDRNPALACELGREMLERAR